MTRVVPTFPIVAEAHLRLTEPNGVFALGHSIKLFESGLFDTLWERSAIALK